VLAN
jgi:hypothetical protein